MTPVKSDVESLIFEVALSLEDEHLRQELLERTFQNDRKGLDRIKGMLDASGEAASFFMEAREERSQLAAEISPQAHLATPDPSSLPAEAGSTIGDYLLVRCLGEGGSGIVYEAEQEHPVKRRVALKIFRIDTASTLTKTRFDIERQALAIMDHPNIAKVLDVGGFHNGSPYFVLELVEGVPITTFCDRERLDVRRRVELFMDVCDAIQHAHSKRIIHRDIKPNNVLVSSVDGRPVAKVIDFGIAKAVATSFKVEPTITGHDQFIGTPAYMSPEQVEMIGIDVDTRSDVYSLGVLLYELLVSHTPLDHRMLTDSGMAVMRKLILENRHLKPSARLASLDEREAKETASARSTELPRLISSVQGELDWIIMKALDKDRNCRYETTNALALDLQSYLENKPVSARRPSNLYTFTKFVRRNRIPFYSAVAGALSILLGLGATTTLYFREKSALKEQERLSIAAEKARDQELQLRRQAQARANVSLAAFLLGEGKVGEADELLRQNPLVSIEPSKEAATVFRTLGNWYATYDRWSEAVECFRLMTQATQLHRTEEILRGTDLLVIAPALVELRDKAGYEKFRADTLSKHPSVRDSLEAEHLLKACLITRASPEVLRKLEAAAALCDKSVRGHTTGAFPAWEAFSLALYHHRKADFAKVLETGRAGLAAPNIKEVCAAGLKALMAIANHELGHDETARADFKYARSIIRKPKFDDSGEEKTIFPKWYDWSVASQLLKEADKALRPAS